MSETLTRTETLADLAARTQERRIKPVFDTFKNAYARLKTANDQEEAFADMLIAMEAFGEVWETVTKDYRAALQETMIADGVPEMRTDTHIFQIKGGSVKGEVLDEKALRAAAPDLFLPQPDRLDRTALTKRLKAGIVLPGAELTTGQPVFSIRRKS